MTPDAFIAKWRANERNERSAAQEFFCDLCALLDEPTPNTDPDGRRYAFEKGASKAGGGSGWADVWKRDCFAWEFKKPRGDLASALRQLQNYMLALENPPLLVVSDMRRIVIRTNWTATVSETHELTIEDLAETRARRLLKAVLSDPERLRPSRTREALTLEAAGEFAALARRLRARGHEPFAVAHFLNRIVFCLFADDVDLLPRGLLDRMLETAAQRPEQFAAMAGELFRAMKDPGGRIGFDAVPWFNGGLFDDDATLPLLAGDVRTLRQVAALDWGEIDPSILGTLFERGLDPENPQARAESERRLSGIHYTDRATIEKIIVPLITTPLLREWGDCKARIGEAMARRAAAREARQPRPQARADAEAKALLSAFLDRLRGFRVLDPACGSGNFLYLALLALKDLEHRVGLEAEALGLQREFSRIGPEVLRGIELNPYAAELARVSVWIGAIQWARRNGLAHPENPILQPLATIECRDAVLGPDGAAAPWPAAEAIIGNPPFIGDKAMRKALGDGYVERLRAAYAGRVPGGADFVCYWFEKAREAVAGGGTERAGLVATNSIRGGASRTVLERIAADARIFDAWDDEPWALDGAAVRVSLVCFQRRGDAAEPARLDGAQVQAIFPDLTAGGLDLTTARPLKENAGCAFVGVQKTGAFEVTREVAAAWLDEPINPHGRPNADVVRPWWNGLDVTRRPRDMWIVDFGSRRTEVQAAQYALPYAYVAKHVRPERERNKLKALRETWWRHWCPRPQMFEALAGLARFIVTPEVSKHRVFAWMAAGMLPDKNLTVVTRDDDVSFGILHSRFHEAWALRMGTFLGVGNDPRYTPSTTFRTFPFPEGLTPAVPAAAYAGEGRALAIAAAARLLVEARERWLHPPEWVEEVPDLLPHLPPRRVPRDPKAAALLKGRTLTKLYNARGTPEGRWLDELHRALDEAVAAAYGWPPAIGEDDALAALLSLNHARAH